MKQEEKFTFKEVLFIIAGAYKVFLPRFLILLFSILISGILIMAYLR